MKIESKIPKKKFHTVQIPAFSIMFDADIFKSNGGTLTDDKVKSYVMGLLRDNMPNADWSEVFEK